MDIILKPIFQIAVIPIILALIPQLCMLLGKKGRRQITSNDFASLQSSLVVIGLAINITFALAKNANLEIFYGWTVVLVLALFVIAIIQRYVPWNDWVLHIGCSGVGIFLISLTFLVWK
jgi:hypothetical protein